MMISCQGKTLDPVNQEQNQGDNNSNNGNENDSANAKLKTLIVYYSYTGNTEDIVDELRKQIVADVLKIEPANKTLNYAANNYRIGTEQLTRIQNNPNDETSYPVIDPINVDISKYDAVIIATPLWWSQMASNMQTFLFKYGSQMKGKHIGLIVSSHSSGISGVERDAKRLVPEGVFMSNSLWINASNYSRRGARITEWLNQVGFSSLTPSQTKSLAMTIQVNNHKLICDLLDNSSTRALMNILSEGNITYEAHDYGNFEKVGNIGHKLPSNNENITTQPGDVILYQGDNLCIYYNTNTWNFTRMGKIRNISQQELKSILGEGNVMITLSRYE